MTRKLENRAAVVTGGGSGIGKCVSTRLAADGAHVLVLDIDLDAARQTVDEIAGAGDSAAAYQCDVADHSEVADVIAAILKESHIDILINNAGIAHVGNLENTSEADLDRLYKLTERYCVVYQTLTGGAPVTISRSDRAGTD